MTKDLLILAPTAFLAFGIEATVGFGATVLVVTTTALFLPIEVVLPLFIPANLALSTYLTSKYFRQIALGTLFLKVIPAMALGLPFGLALFNLENQSWLKRGFGIFVIVLAVIELIWSARSRNEEHEIGNRKPLCPRTEIPLLGLGGFIHGVYGSGGPIIVYVLSRRIVDKASFRATLAALWLIANLALIANYALTDRLGIATLSGSLALLVPLAAGLVVGEWLHRKVSLWGFRLGVHFVLLIGGVLLLWQG